jgi:hypothetical protein
MQSPKNRHPGEAGGQDTLKELVFHLRENDLEGPLPVISRPLNRAVSAHPFAATNRGVPARRHFA